MAPVDFDLVIFDNDGVLVDSEPHANRVLVELLASHGIRMTPEECTDRFLGTSLPHIRRDIETRHGAALPADFEQRYHDGLFEAFRTSLTPVPGVVKALDAIAAKTCVASSGTHERIRAALTRVGLFERFEGRIFSASDVARGKPAPDLFLHAAHTLGVDPARCAVVEDSPLGVEAANAAGMTAFGFAGATPAARLHLAGGGVFDSMARLPGLLARPARRRPG